MASLSCPRMMALRLAPALLPALLGVGLATGCMESGPLAPESCPAAIVGESEVPEELPAEVPACAPAPTEILGACVTGELDLSQETALQLELEGVITEVGSGSPPDACRFPFAVGSLTTTAAEPAPAADVRWVRIEADGESWVIALAAPGNTSTLAVGQPVSASIEWSSGLAYLRYSVELRDESGATQWWFLTSGASSPIERTPACLPVRLGPAECVSDGPNSQLQHHAIEIDGAVVSPGEQVIIDELRFTNGGTWFTYEPRGTDVPHGGRVLSGTREG